MPVPRPSSEYGACHPPYAKPPLVSSCGPPPACMTPSRVTKSIAITFLMTALLQYLATFAANIAQMFQANKLDYGSKYLIPKPGNHVLIASERVPPLRLRFTH